MPNLARVKQYTALLHEELDHLLIWLQDQQYITKPAQKRVEKCQNILDLLHNEAVTDYDAQTGMPVNIPPT